MPQSQLTPAAFVAKWKRAKLSERAASQEHFIDLCHLLGQPTPAEHDATGAEYAFEKGITIAPASAASEREGGRGGFADVWWNNKFGWEYKRQGKYKTLDEAYQQLQRYREALNNPWLLIVSDIARTEIHTNFPNAVNKRIDVTLDDIEKGPGLETLRRVFTDPESFRPAQTAEQVTQDVATEIGKIAIRLQEEKHDPHAIAHFLMKCMFCLFAEDVPGLLPNKLFKKLLQENYRDPARFTKLAHSLFQTMATGGDFGTDPIPYFNGGLFDDAPPIKLSTDDLGTLNLAANQDWAHIEPSILGTLFERSLDPSKRAQIGAHYTSKEDILLVVTPVIIDPLRKQWHSLKSTIESSLLHLTPGESPGAVPQNRTRSVSEGQSTAPTVGTSPAQAAKKLLTPIHQQLAQFLAQLSSLKILDPACGSGNFLYVAIQQLLSLEKEIITFAAQPPIFLRLLPRVRPTQLLGIEINPYAAELAQVSIWIGFLQWLHLNGFPVATDTPILSKLQSIDNRDAILEICASSQQPAASRNSRHAALRAAWPDAHFIVGNPPFLGSSLFRSSGLPDDYVSALFKAYDLPKTSDLCCYWFELARRKIESAKIHIAPGLPGVTSRPVKKSKSQQTPPPSEISNPQISNPFPTLSLPRIGLLATQGIRGGDNRTVLQRIKQSGDIFMAWSDKEWLLDGAAVNVSIVAFDDGNEATRTLDGVSVSELNADLSSGAATTGALELQENIDVAFRGNQKGGSFDIEWQVARKMLSQPNPSGKSNFDVLKPYWNGMDLTRRPRSMWLIDFGLNMPLTEASKYEAPIKYVEQYVKPERDENRRDHYREKWWIHNEPRPTMRGLIGKQQRYCVCPHVAKHFALAWMQTPSLPDHQLIAFAREDDFFFGVIQSTVHELWELKLGTQLEDRPRYTPKTCFETFPLPWPPGKENTKHPAHNRIAAAAKELNDLRERWLNPPELLEPLAQILDASDDFSDVPKEARPLLRHSALMAAAAKSPNLKKRTLTNLYNERPTWLKLAHEKLDRAVLAAYAHIDPEGNGGGWSEDWATLYTDTGAGSPLPPDHPRAKERSETDQKILTNLLRLNQLRSAQSSPQV